MAATRIQIVLARDFSFGVLPDGVDRSSEAFSHNSKAMDALISHLQSHINKVFLFLSMPQFLLLIRIHF